MSGAQGAEPKGSLTATTYESVSVAGGENRTKTDLRSKEDVGGIQIDKLQDKVQDPIGKGGPVFGAGAGAGAASAATDDDNVDDNLDLGVTGTA